MCLCAPPTEAVESLRDAVMENTSCAQRSKSRRRVGASHAPRSGGASSRANGLPLLKDDKINVRKEKVSDALVCVCDVLVPALRR